MVQTAGKLYECHHCGYKTMRYHVIRSHVEGHLGIKRFACTKCDYRTNYKFQLKNHKASRHWDKKRYECPHCDYKTPYSGSLKSHEAVHSGEKPFACDHCDHRCARKKDLRDHMAIHTGWKPYECSFCDYKCSTPKYLRNHLRVHTGEKPFKCHMCNFQSAHRAALRKHVEGHYGVFKFACQYCKYKTQYRTNWKHHVMLHEGDRPHNCPHCPLSFIAVNALNNHMRVHTGETPFECPTCSSVFSNRKSWKGHLTSCFPGHPALSEARRQVAKLLPEDLEHTMAALASTKPQGHEKSILEYHSKMRQEAWSDEVHLSDNEAANTNQLTDLKIEAQQGISSSTQDPSKALIIQTNHYNQTSFRTANNQKDTKPKKNRQTPKTRGTIIKRTTKSTTVEFIIELPRPKPSCQPVKTKPSVRTNSIMNRKSSNHSYQFFDEDTKIGEYSV